ncbi:LOW QUALITY PROTEIN: uncharacterized protein FPRO_06728 [Fusarium proliferatum ET1]|uniref:Uncharacterized protein n=1 Tax=Fusarium proliferatum (strain ET1) TaxID=1227346 RepID=A0A1L7VBI7_FUSPR|nr:LOW QUALITY PROTEIN: uncharacterized protein FPRO_06728 [Fusarium proliferatum ET1]CZR38081.1 uncharacterized protein FPRO_06728 [Fusarium proliferatum ET1]
MAMLSGMFLREHYPETVSFFAPPASADTDDEVNLSIDTLGIPASDNSNRYNALPCISCAWFPPVHLRAHSTPAISSWKIRCFQRTIYPRILVWRQVYVSGTPSAAHFLLTGRETGGKSSILTSGGQVFPAPVPTHYHKHTHHDFICISGQLKVWLNGQYRILSPGDYTSVAPVSTSQVLFGGIQFPDVDYCFYVSDGNLEVTISDTDSLRMGPDEVAWLPAGTHLDIRPVSSYSKVLVYAQPGGLVDLLYAVGKESLILCCTACFLIHQVLWIERSSLSMSLGLSLT